jgi:hypothetical protein
LLPSQKDKKVCQRDKRETERNKRDTARDIRDTAAGTERGATALTGLGIITGALTGLGIDTAGYKPPKVGSYVGFVAVEAGPPGGGEAGPTVLKERDSVRQVRAPLRSFDSGSLTCENVFGQTVELTKGLWQVRTR